MPRTLSVLSIGSGQAGKVSQPQTSNTARKVPRADAHGNATPWQAPSIDTRLHDGIPVPLPRIHTAIVVSICQPCLVDPAFTVEAACTSGSRYTFIHTLIVLTTALLVRLCARLLAEEKPPDQAHSSEPSSCTPPQIPSPCSTLHVLVPRFSGRARLGLSLRFCNLIKSTRTSLQTGSSHLLANPHFGSKVRGKPIALLGKCLEPLALFTTTPTFSGIDGCW